MVTLTDYVTPGPDLQYTGLLALRGFSLHLPAKYKWKPKKVLPSDCGALALCHMVNPALVIPLRSSKGYMGPEVATFWTKTFNFTQVTNLNWLAKLNWGGPSALVVNIIVNYCCSCALLYAKKLKETETEETRLICHIFITVDIKLYKGVFEQNFQIFDMY